MAKTRAGPARLTPAAHCWIFKASWRATSLRLRVEAHDLDSAYKKAENSVRRMLGGSSCMSVECEKQVY